MEGSLGGRIAARGNEICLEGVDEKSLRRFKSMVDNLIAVVRDGETPTPDYVKALTSDAFSGVSGENTEQSFVREAVIQIPHGFNRVYPRGSNQAAYIQGMRACDIAFCVGPAGTGKTYLAIAEALRLVLSKKLRKIILTRPVVEAGESLGFLPGDLAQKINPYLRPLYDAMESLIPFEVIRRMEETRLIEIAPLAYMRGRSLRNCVVILDEAQNTTREQMKMFLTRLGEDARAIITGDITQIDLPSRKASGLIHAVKILRGIQEIGFTFFGASDIVRHPLVRKIIHAYESESN
jgi:phosphate starvation-inducible PhoH-like protein